MTDLHAEIMNLKADGDKREEACYGDYDCYDLYNIGHRDARHVAAELSLKAEGRIEELELALRDVYLDSGFRNLCESLQDKIEELLK